MYRVRKKEKKIVIKQFSFFKTQIKKNKEKNEENKPKSKRRDIKRIENG